MRSMTTLTALVVLTLPVGLLVSAGAPAQAAAETCDGRVATAIVPPTTTYPPPVFVGTPGDDVIVGTERGDVIDGAGGNDTICGFAGRDDLTGGPGDDRIFGGLDEAYSADDDYFGDRLVPGPGDDFVDLGHDPQSEDLFDLDTGYWDQVSYADAAGPVTVDLSTGIATGEGTDTIAPIAYAGGIEGSSHGDVLTGRAGPDWITSGGGDDTIAGGAGDDLVNADQLSHPLYRPPAPQPGADVVDGGEGADTIVGGYGADLLTGGTGADAIRAVDSDGTRVSGGSGADWVGGSGRLRVEGDGGGDTLHPDVDGPGLITMDGGAGRDRVLLDVSRTIPASGRMVIGRPRGTVRIEGRTAVRLRSYTSFKLNAVPSVPVTWWGTVGRDVVDLENANARVRAYGRDGADLIRGSWNADLLDGGPGRDRLDGSAGRDRCVRGERLTSCEQRRR